MEEKLGSSARTRVGRNIASLRLLVHLARERGVPDERSLADSGISTADLLDPQAESDIEQEFVVIRNLQAWFGGEIGLGLEVGLRYRVSTYGALGYAVASSATLRDAYETAVDYLRPAYTGLALHLEHDASEFRLVMDDTPAPAEVRQFLVERMMAGFYAVTREVLGAPDTVYRTGRLELRFARPAYAEAFGRIGGREVVFAAPRHLIAGDSALLELPSLLRDEQARHIFLFQHERRKTHAAGRHSLAMRVREQLLADPARMPDLETLATRFAMTERTLRRRLEEEGTGYRQLVDATRRACAEDLLKAGASVEQVAERLGFSEASSFIHAYKRWTGTTPGRSGGAE